MPDFPIKKKRSREKITVSTGSTKSNLPWKNLWKKCPQGSQGFVWAICFKVLSKKNVCGNHTEEGMAFECPKCEKTSKTSDALNQRVILAEGVLKV